jgi:peroxiredoxin
MSKNQIVTLFKSPIFCMVLMLSLSFCAQNGGGESTQALFAATFPDANGQQKALKPYQGKIVVLNFWATWCEPCREEMPELSILHDAYKDKNVVVLGVAVDDVGNINEFLKSNKISYPLFAADDAGMNLAAGLGNSKSVLPFTVIIKADGSIAKSYFGRVTKPLLEQTLLPLIKK